MAKTTRLPRKDSNGRTLHVGDRVKAVIHDWVSGSVDNKVTKVINLEGTIQEIYQSSEWIGSWDKGTQKQVPIVVARIRHSARSVNEDTINLNNCTFLAKGQAFTREQIQAAANLRAAARVERFESTVSKAHKLCYILQQHGPMTRIEAMRRLHALDGRKGRFSPTSNHEYWSTCTRYDGWESPVARGFITVVDHTETGAYIFGVTKKGLKLVKAYLNWREAA